jgi:hypothetical protein
LIIHKFENIWRIADRFGADKFAFGEGAAPAMI